MNEWKKNEPPGGKYNKHTMKTREKEREKKHAAALKKSVYSDFVWENIVKSECWSRG